MKKILLVCHDYYPFNAPGSHRIHSFVKHLPTFGYEPTILCTDCNAKNSTWHWTRDCYDPDLVGKEVCRTVRVAWPDPPSKFEKALARIFPFSYPTCLRNNFLRDGAALLEDESFDVILATCPTPLSFSVAAALSERYDIPWLADLRDVAGQTTTRVPWTRPWAYRYLLYRKIRIRRETQVCRTAQAVTTVSHALADTLRARGLRNVHVVYNGFEPDNYESTSPLSSQPFRIVYAGRVYPSQGRDPSPLFDALDMLLQKGMFDGQDMEVCFYGPNQSVLEPMLENRACKRVVKVLKTVGYRRMCHIMKNATMLLHLSHAHDKGIATSKIFEYLGARRPILSVPGDGDVVDSILQETQAGESLGNPEKIADTILRCYEEWKSTGTVVFDCNAEAVNRYTRKNQTSVLAKTLDELLLKFTSEKRC